MRRLSNFAMTFVLVAAFAASAAAQSGGGFDADWNGVAGGGEASVGGGYSLIVTAAELDVGVSASGGFAFEGGLAPGVCSSTITPFGVGCPGSGGFVPSLEIVGCIATGYDAVVRIAGGLGGSQAFFVIGLVQASTPIGGGCLLNVAPLVVGPVGPIPLSAGGPGGGNAILPTTIPPIVPAVVGGFTVQVLIGDPASPIGFTATNGVDVFYGN